MPTSSRDIDWTDMMRWAEQQAIVGIIYRGIQRAGKALNMPFDVLMEWVGYANQIEMQNRLINKRCIEVVEMLSHDGFKCCILKGPGNASMYPEPLLRSSGDIDVLVKANNKKDGSGVRSVIEYVRRKNPFGRASYHHVDYGNYNGVKVEIHYRPTYMCSPIHNIRLQKLLLIDGNVQNIDLIGENSYIPIPFWDFNVVYQLIHIYRHLLNEGIGFRQIIDYYYLLKNEECRVKNEEGSASRAIVLEHLGLAKISGAVMWVLKEVFGLEEKCLIAPVDERRGRFLLWEILRGGNFGKYDTRGYFVRWNNPIGSCLRHVERDMRLVRYFPSECLWEPVFRVYHFGWRLVH